MVFFLFISGQLLVAAIVVFVLKYKLDEILLDIGIQQMEVLSSEKKAKVKAVTVITHKSLSTKYQDRIVRTVSKQFGSGAALSFQIDKNLMGGAIFKLGDVVAFDCSLRERLQRAKQGM
jgi:F0F1-type ATP synthase delta subunit